MPTQSFLLELIRLIGAPVFIIVVLGIGVEYARTRRGRISAPMPPLNLQPLEDRLGRMEQAVEAMSVEIERMAEGQRFTNRLLSSKQKTAAQLPAGDA